jgi:DNA-binding FadR family transcriptional regulator
MLALYSGNRLLLLLFHGLWLLMAEQFESTFKPPVL